MTPFAAVVLAHRDPTQLKRLLNALEDIPIVLHVDAGTDPVVGAEIVAGLPGRVQLCAPVHAELASWSLVEAELRGLRLALKTSSARHVAVLSGSDYPLVPMQTLAEELEPWEGRSFLWNVPIPYRNWDTPRNPNGGRWRFDHWFMTRKNHVVHLGSIPVHWPLRRRVPAELNLRAASQWKIYSREHVEALLHVADTRPDLMRYWRSTFVPDETFAASVLASPALLGSAALTPCYAHAWYIDWPTAHSYHPRWLTDQDLPALLATRHAPAPTPQSAAVRPGNQDLHQTTRKLFARKFNSETGRDALDQIDRSLRIASSGPRAEFPLPRENG